ncbi:membrane protein [Microbacterium phage Cece]|nr:membrane protein [Microbacterium phage Cece]
MKNRIKRWLGILAASTLLAGGATLAVAAPASATNISQTCTVATLEPHRALQNGDHINIDVTKDGQKFQVNAYVDQNIHGGYGPTKLGLRLTTPNGQFQVPLKAEEVETGKLTFKFGEYLSGQYTVEWIQFNDHYFNQDRNPANFLECNGRTPLPAVANIFVHPATCDAPGRAEWGLVVNATKDNPVLDQTPGEHSADATAIFGTIFANGTRFQKIPYTIEPQLDPNKEPCIPPIPAGEMTYGEWSAPAFDCHNKAGDEVGITRLLTSVPYAWDPITRTYVLNPDGAEQVVERDVYIVTEADIKGLDCPVVTPPTEPEPTPTPTPTPDPTPTPTPTPTPDVTPAPEPTPTPESSVTPAPEPVSATSPLTCDDFQTQGLAQYALASYPNLDEDNDGIACEALPTGERAALAATGGTGIGTLAAGGVALLLVGGLLYGVRRLVKA